MEKNIKKLEDLPLIMTVKDIMNVLGISKTNAYSLFNRSDFPSININRRKFVSRDKFFEWLEMQTNVMV